MKAARSITLAITGALLFAAQTPNWAAQIDPTFQTAVLGGTVQSIMTDEDGFIVIGGDFKEVNGVPQNGVARLSAAGEVHPAFGGVGVNGVVKAVAGGPAGVVYAGGRFGQFAGVAAPNLVQLLPTGEPAENFNIGAGPSGTVHCLAFDTQGRILVGGAFRMFDHTPAIYLARITLAGELDLAFESALQPTFAIESGVSAIAVQPDGKILVGGIFQTSRGFEYLVRLNVNGSLDETFSAEHGPLLYTHAIVPLNDGTVLVGGLDKHGKGFVEKLNSDRSVNAGFLAPEFDGPVQTMVVDSAGRVLVGGAFRQPSRGIARLQPNGAVDESWNLALAGVVNALTFDGGGQLLVGGIFENRSALVRIIDDAPVSSLERNLQSFGQWIRCEPGKQYVIEASPDLQAWSEFSGGLAGGSGIRVVDPAIRNVPRRFFRARLIQ